MLKWWPGKSPLYFEAKGRDLALHSCTSEYTLFIDADEIVDPGDFRRWLNDGRYQQFKSLKLAQYLYTMRPSYRLFKRAYNTVLCNTEWAQSLPFCVEARFNAYWNNKNRLSRWLGKIGISGDFGYYRGKPFIHHFTNVRSRVELEKKLNNWSHTNDRTDWDEVLKDFYKTAGNKKISGDRYKIVDNKFNIDETGLYKIS